MLSTLAVNVEIRCFDTKVIILGNMHLVQPVVKFCSEWALTTYLGKEVCLALPAFHILTGCDFNSAFK